MTVWLVRIWNKNAQNAIRATSFCGPLLVSRFLLVSFDACNFFTPELFLSNLLSLLFSNIDFNDSTTAPKLKHFRFQVCFVTEIWLKTPLPTIVLENLRRKISTIILKNEQICVALAPMHKPRYNFFVYCLYFHHCAVCIPKRSVTADSYFTVRKICGQ